ncbi:queuosine precursor transporter [Portibacter lacus]|uniref:Probable queuosine precursor transporter n=1 Tax=Portibacter lacus TaxID=1099794 RepID=A0AA37WGF8_9BACT|nr:queuosine precursor transporter [Portibacter lacus]GLR18299.1 membrane protein [Portibacter lacus]
MAHFLSNKVNKLFLILGGFFVANAIVAEFIGIKIFSLERTLGLEPMNLSLFGVDGLGFSLTAGVLLWPVVFVMTDVINEYYGQKGVKFLSYLTVGLISYAFVMVFFAIWISPDLWWRDVSGTLVGNEVSDMDLAFRKVFGQGLWIIVGSLVAFLVGQVIDVFVFHKIKKITGEGKIWLRATGSTLISQFIDSFVVLIIAFYIGGDWDLVRVLAIGTVNYLYKFVMAIVLTPAIYFAHFIIEKYLGKKDAERIKKQAMHS